MRAVPNAEHKMHALIENLRSNTTSAEAARWLDLVRNSFVHPQTRGGMKGWTLSHNEQEVETLQATFDHENKITRLWTPGRRKMVWNPFGVKFHTDNTDPSSRPFRGTVTLAQTEDVYIGYADDFLQIVVYHAVDDARKV